MEKLFTLEYGVGGACVLLTIIVLLKVGEFVWEIRKEKDSASDLKIKHVLETIDKMERRLENLEKNVAELPKFRIDVRRFYSAIKELAGSRWSEIRDEIMKDDFTL